MNNAEQIALWEEKIKQLTKYLNCIKDAPANTLQEYCRVCERIDRLTFGIKQLRKKIKEE